MSEEDKATLSRVLVVMPEDGTTRELLAYLERRALEVLWVREGPAAFDILDADPPVDALICDLRHERIDGLRVIQVGLRRNSNLCAIVIANVDEIELGTEAMRQGAYDFQVRPLNLPKISAVLDRGLSYQRLMGEVSELQRRLDDRYRMGGIARRSPHWQRIYNQIEQVAQSKAIVLLSGETGTGKGEVAKAIHQQSRRRERPFVEINGGALPEGIVESELFGHEKGAFTGAANSHKGRFELADLGTLFLDEVGDLSPPTQVKILRVIQAGEFERVGGTHTHKVDVRLITATNRDLESMVEQGGFRADLFYRLNVVRIEVPPLRECPEDIPILIDEFVHQFSTENDKTINGLTPAASDALLQYDWPGNVRELKNCLEGMVVMSKGEGEPLDLVDVPSQIRRNAPRHDDTALRLGMTMKEIEKKAITDTLASVGQDRRQAAEVLQIGLSTLYRKLKEYDIP